MVCWERRRKIQRFKINERFKFNEKFQTIFNPVSKIPEHKGAEPFLFPLIIPVLLTTFNLLFYSYFKFVGFIFFFEQDSLESNYENIYTVDNFTLRK